MINRSAVVLHRRASIVTRSQIWYKFVLHGWLEGLIRSMCMWRNGSKRNVREGEIQEWILKVSQKKEQEKGTLINYVKKKQCHVKGKTTLWKIKLVNNADLKKATWVIKTADYFFDIIPNCISFSSNFKRLLKSK